MRDVDESFDMGSRCRNAPPQHFKYREVKMRVADRADVAGPHCACHSLVGNGSRLIDFAQHPQHQRKVRGNGYAYVLGETKRRIAMKLWIENVTRAFEKSTRCGEITSKPFSRPVEAKTNDSFERVWPRLDFAQNQFRDFA